MSDTTNGCINCNKTHNFHDGPNLIALIILQKPFSTGLRRPSTAVRQEVRDRRVGDRGSRGLSCKPYQMEL